MKSLTEYLTLTRHPKSATASTPWEANPTGEDNADAHLLQFGHGWATVGRMTAPAVAADHTSLPSRY